MHKSIQQQQGLTLMELMVTVVILGILVGVAFPAYKGQVSQTRRASATACLTEFAQYMERIYTTNMTYAKNNNIDVQLPETNCRKDLAGSYEFSLVKDQTTFNLTASPKGSQQDDTCGALTLNQLGVRTAGGKSDATTIRACW